MSIVLNNKSFQLSNIQKNITILSFAITILLLIYQEWTHAELNSLMVAVILSVPLWVLPKQVFLYYVFFSIPLTFGIHGLFCLLIYLSLLLRIGVTNKLQIFFPVAFITFETINCIIHVPQIAELSKIVVYFSFLGVLFYALLMKNIEINKLLKSFCYGVGFGLLLLYGRVLIISSFNELMEVSSRGDFDSYDGPLHSRENHFIANANYIAYFSIALLSTVICTYKYLKLHWIEIVILVAIAILAGSFTYSRTWVLCTALIILLYFVMSGFKDKIVFVFILTTTIYCIASTNSELSNSIFSGFESRFEEIGFATAGNRTTIFDDYNKFLFAHPEYWLFGTGTIYYNTICMQVSSIHNGTQQIYVCTGIIGILLFVTLLFKLKVLYKNKKNLVQWIPLIIIFFFDQSVQSLSPSYLLFPFIMGAYALRIESTEYLPNKQ